MIATSTVAVSMKFFSGYSLGLCLYQYRLARLFIFIFILVATITIPAIQAYRPHLYPSTILGISIVALIVTGVTSAVAGKSYWTLFIEKIPEIASIPVLSASVGFLAVAAAITPIAQEFRIAVQVLFCLAIICGCFYTKIMHGK